jgi:hypothetical protein
MSLPPACSRSAHHRTLASIGSSLTLATISLLTPAPKLERRWACIAGADRTLLAAQLSSYFNEVATYFAVLEFPAAALPSEAVPRKDDIGQMLMRRAATFINNCLAQFQPDKIILLGLPPAAHSCLRGMLPLQKLVTVESEAELLTLPFVTTTEPMKCKPRQAIEGLVAAKLAKRPLAFSEDAPDFPARQLTGKKGLILLESDAGVAEVAIINYAASNDVDIVVAPPVERFELRPLARQLQEWADDRSGPALREVRKKVTDRTKDIDFRRYEFATFFTSGLPYGLILKNAIPFTHVMNGPYCGVFLANAIAEEGYPAPIGSALLFSLDEFSSDETLDVAERLEQNNFVVTPLIGHHATNENLTNYGSQLPYDILHICSHGGETDGYFVKHDFDDRDGKAHTLEYFEVVSFAPGGGYKPDEIRVEQKIIFAKLDGVPWTQRPLSMFPRYVGEDMMQSIRNEKARVKRTPVDVPIALSCHIKCYRSFHQGMFDQLAAHASPMIFNNSCSSSHELASSFLATGARCYIATLWPVGDSTAQKAALAFYDSLLGGGTVLSAFAATLRSIVNNRYKNIYILWGLHFTSLARPATKSDQQIIAGLATGYDTWIRKFAATNDEEIRRNCFPIVKFLSSELKRRIPPERIQQFFAGAPEIERSSEIEPELNELVITTEMGIPEETSD